MKVKRHIIEIDEDRCDGCGQCVISCAEGALELRDGKAMLVSEHYCDGLGACVGECPQGALKVVEREAEDFDPEAVEQHIETRAVPNYPLPPPPSPKVTLPCGCPSAQVCTVEQGERKNWPVKIRLVSPQAPFFRHIPLFIVADCAPAACRRFHETVFQGKDAVMLIGCPKFDDLTEYYAKLAQILRSSPIPSVSVVRMEVPCCSGLTTVVERAMREAGRVIPCCEIVISAQGKVISRGAGAKRTVV